MDDVKYMGLDVHPATISVVVLDSTGHLVRESIIETKAATILQLIHGLSGSLQVTLEEGTCTAVMLRKSSMPAVDESEKAPKRLGLIRGYRCRCKHNRDKFGYTTVRRAAAESRWAITGLIP
jgi:hypothetical protein